MIFETHAHYDDGKFDKDREELLSSMKENGIGTIVNVGSDMESSRWTVKAVERYSMMYGAVGVHPSETGRMKQEDIEELRQLSQGEKIVAIGEIGLDYYWVKDVEGRRAQAEIFRAQMRLAGRLGLPVIIHGREAHLDSLTIVEQYPKVRGVFHCYSGSVELAKRLLDLGYLLSFTGVLTYKNARKAVEVVRATPLDRLMIETDAPYMAPVPYRGKRNSSLYVYRMAEAIAEIKDLPLETVIAQTTENGKRLFGI